ncbi:MAG: ABC-2 family transporter protein [Minicystis sp.]
MSALGASLARAARAYPTLLRVGLAEAVAYRAEMVVWMLTTTMPLVSLALWSAVASKGPVGRFGQQQFGAYFLCTLVVRQLTGSWLVWALNMEIRSGTLSQRLLRPIHPLVSYSAENLSAVPMRALISAPMAVIAMFVIEPGSLPHTPGRIALILASLVGAWTITFFTMALVGALAFFIESSTSIFEIWLVVFGLLSGYLVPLELLPGWLQTISDALPFRYTVAFPVEATLGLLPPGAALRNLAVQWAYVAGCAGAALWVWRAGIRRFSAFGG